MLYQFALDYPRLSFGLCLCALALPFVPVLRNSAALAWPRWMRWYRTALIVSAIAWAATASARYLAAALPYIEGVDFFFYLCVARDFLHGAGGDSLAKYGYFPGGYRYWEAVMALFGAPVAHPRVAVRIRRPHYSGTTLAQRAFGRNHAPLGSRCPKRAFGTTGFRTTPAQRAISTTGFRTTPAQRASA